MLFELTICERNSKGELTGKKRTYENDSAYKIWEQWAKHVSSFTTGKNKHSYIPDAEEAQKILKAVKYKKPEPVVEE